MNVDNINIQSRDWIFKLLPLVLGSFCIGLTEFLIMGVLPEVADSLKITIPQAGYLIAIYAFGVVIGAPLLIKIVFYLDAKKTLMFLMGIFFIFNFLFSISSSITALLIFRFLAGLPHGAFFGIAAVVGTYLAPRGKGAFAVAIMFTGLTLANVIGVPLGTYIGHEISWRFAYFLIAILGFVALIGISIWLPLPAINPLHPSTKRSDLFKNYEAWLIFAVSAIGTAGMFSWMSYIAPLMINEARFSSNSLTLIMMLAGLGMAIGNLIGGRLADVFSPLKVIFTLLCCMMISLYCITQVIHYPVLILTMTFVTGAIAFAVVPAMQMLMIQAAKGSEMLASSIVQASGNLANTLGAYLGGLPIAAGFAYTAAEYVGIGLVFIGLIFCILIAKHRHHKKSVNLQPVNEYK